MPCGDLAPILDLTRPVLPYRERHRVKVFGEPSIPRKGNKWAAKKPLAMTRENWRRYNSAIEYHIYMKNLVKADFRDPLDVLNPITGNYVAHSYKDATKAQGQ